jgi:hypothetical protein
VWLRNRFIRMLPYMPWKGLIAGGVQRRRQTRSRSRTTRRSASTPDPGDRTGKERALAVVPPKRGVPQGQSAGALRRWRTRSPRRATP